HQHHQKPRLPAPRHAHHHPMREQVVRRKRKRPRLTQPVEGPRPPDGQLPPMHHGRPRAPHAYGSPTNGSPALMTAPPSGGSAVVFGADSGSGSDSGGSASVDALLLAGGRRFFRRFGAITSTAR